MYGLDRSNYTQLSCLNSQLSGKVPGLMLVVALNVRNLVQFCLLVVLIVDGASPLIVT